ncbi:MAG: hypothetical protein V3W31_05615 [Thermodesulfobacteriota bacterium]
MKTAKTKASTYYPIIVFLCLALLTGQWGCAHALKPPSSGEVRREARAELGTVGVVPARFEPEVGPGASTTERITGRLAVAGKETGKGTLQGTAVGGTVGATILLGGMSACTGSGLFVGPCIVLFTALAAASVVGGAAIGTVVGTVKGISKALPKKALNERETAIEESLSAHDIQEEMGERLSETVRARTSIPLFLIAARGPASPGDKTDHRVLTGEGVDTVIEISVLNVDLRNAAGERQEHSLFMTVNTKLIRTADNTELHARTFEYLGAERSFGGRDEIDAGAFGEELEKAYEELSLNIVEGFLLSHPPFPPFSPSPPPSSPEPPMERMPWE